MRARACVRACVRTCVRARVLSCSTRHIVARHCHAARYKVTKWHRADQLGVKAEQELSQSGAPQQQLELKVGSRVRLVVYMGGMHNGQCGEVVRFAPPQSGTSSVQHVGTFDRTTTWPVVRFHHTSVSLSLGTVPYCSAVHRRFLVSCCPDCDCVQSSGGSRLCCCCGREEGGGG